MFVVCDCAVCVRGVRFVVCVLCLCGVYARCVYAMYETLNILSNVVTAKHWLGSGLFSDGSYVMVVGF